MNRTTRSLLVFLVLAAALLGAVPAAAEPRPSSEVLLPYFEINLLKPSASNTVFAVGNALAKPVDIEITVYTNWGLPVVKSNLTLAARQVRNFNLRNWIAGDLPDRKLSSTEVSHLKAALSGQRSPRDTLYYSSSIGSGVAVGSIRVKALGKPQPDALWGNYFLINGDSKSLAQSSVQGDTLINLDPGVECRGGCSRHGLRFLTEGTFDDGTQLVIWSEAAVAPSATSQPASYVQADTLAYNEAGQALGGSRLRLLPVQVVSVADLGLREASGWIDLQTDRTSVVAVHYSSKKLYGVALMSYCLPDPPADPGFPGIRIQKLTNGADAVAAPGPSIKVGAPVLWEYIVENTGELALTDVEVSDDDGSIAVSCPKAELGPGERMTCTGRGTAQACQYKNLGTATAKRSDGKSVSADDESYYFGDENAAIGLRLLVNGQDADSVAAQLNVEAGSKLDWTYIVTNQGDVALNEIKVSDDKGDAVSCPRTSLRPGESMTCGASGTAGNGQVVKMGSASGKTTCAEVRDDDPGYYNGKPHEDKFPGLTIRKLTDGGDYSAAPGKNIPIGGTVRWDYIVTNTGGLKLDNIQVKDDKEGAVSCPKSSLQPDESMTCSKTGVVKACQYSNVGTVTATAPNGTAASASDASWYFGQSHPALQIKAYTNGKDGAEIPTGSPVQWTYVVTNSGDVALRDVRVTDDHVANVSCPKSGLQAGESMTCSASGVAGKGPFSNTATATGTADTLCGGNASASDPSQYMGINLPPPCNGKPSLDSLWPPNHKMVDIQVLGIVDPNGDPVTIKVTGITQDEPVDEKGDGNTGPDGAGVGTSTAQVRAERSGLNDGRVYAIHYNANDNQGGGCSGTVFVGVPHDQSGAPPVDSGQIYDSTVSK
jgi:hypothetical protein